MDGQPLALALGLGLAAAAMLSLALTVLTSAAGTLRTEYGPQAATRRTQ
jgi:hypothetical protein